jgi:Lon protease-like protein
LDRIPLFPLDVVLFPGELFGLHVFEERYLLMTEEVLAENLPIGIVLAKQDQPEGRIEFEPEDVGTAAHVIAHEQVGDRFLLQTVGTRRFRIVEVHSEKPYQEATVEWLDELEGDPDEARELVQEVLHRVEDLGGSVGWEEDGADDPVIVSHAIAAALTVDLVSKQALLASTDAEERLRLESQLLALMA